MKMRLRFHISDKGYLYLARFFTALAIACAVGALWDVFMAPRFPSRPVRQALELADTDADSALTLIENTHTRFMSGADRCRMAALHSYARWRAGYDDTLSVAGAGEKTLGTLRALGKSGKPYLTRGLIGAAAVAENRADYQTALNLLQESYSKAWEEKDAFVAARAARSSGRIYKNLTASKPSVEWSSKARDIYGIIKDTTSQDLCRTLMAAVLARSFNENEVLEAVSILDSMQPRMAKDAGYAEYVEYSRTNLQPRFRAGRYDEVLKFGKQVLSEKSCRPVDSLWAYAFMARAAIRLRDYDVGRSYLDSAKMKENLISRRSGKTTISLAHIEYELLDSLGLYTYTRPLFSRIDAENDSLFALYRTRIELITPTFSDKSPMVYYQVGVLAIILIALLFLSASASIAYLRHYNKSKARQLDILREETKRLALRSDQFEAKVLIAENRAARLADELKSSQTANNAVYEELKDRSDALNLSQHKVAELSDRIRELAKASGVMALLSDMDIFLKSNIDIINELLRLLDDQDASSTHPSLRFLANDTLKKLRTQSFIDSLEAVASVRDSLFAELHTELRHRVSGDLYRILLLTILGFRWQAQMKIMALTRSSYYRKRDNLIKTLYEINHPAGTRELIIRYFKKPK